MYPVLHGHFMISKYRHLKVTLTLINHFLLGGKVYHLFTARQSFDKLVVLVLKEDRE